MREIEFHDLVMSELDKLEGKSFKVLIFDTWTRFENTFHPVVQKDPMRFKQFYSPRGDIKGAEIWKASFDYEAIVIDRLLQIAPLVILSTHLKDHNIGAVKTGAQVPDCKKPQWWKNQEFGFGFVIILMDRPIGLVLKRLSKVEVGTQGIVPINVLPRKINPCTWPRILEYWDKPIGDNEPSADEVPNAFELSILDGVLTADQKDDGLIVLKLISRSRMKTRREGLNWKQNELQSRLLDCLTYWRCLVNQRVIEANGGALPSTDAEISGVASKLFGGV